jgi:uncharacterized protein YPO0396
MLLINWHYFSYQLVDFDRINFLTGVNASGKSTLIDALQLLILGDTAGSFFNKAANEKSRRSLRGYLRGEVAESEEKGLVYLRGGNFSSYIVGEFEDTLKENFFCLGAVFDCSASGDYSHRFFSLAHGLPDNHFINRRTPFSIELLKVFLYETYGRQAVEFFDSNQRYREVFRGRMGNLNEKFFRLFRKAVPFSPIMDIKGFISEFVCDISGGLDVENMLENIRYYKQLEGELEFIKKRIKSLEDIGNCYRIYEGDRARIALQQYIIARAGLEQTGNEIKALHNEAGKAAHKINDIDRELAEADASINELEAKRNLLFNERNLSDVSGLERRLKGEKDRLQLQVDMRVKNQERIGRTLMGMAAIWGSLVKELENAEADRPDLSPLLPGLEFLSSAVSRPAGLLSREKLTAVSSAMRDFRRALADVFAAVKEELARGLNRLKQLENEVRELERGVKPYPRQLSGLITAIAAEIRKVSGREAAPRVFADLIEIKDEQWRNAIEGYLHTQKFYLLVEPDFFLLALNVYDRLKFQREFYDLGIVDISKVLSRNTVAMPESLAGEIITPHRHARAYADFLLGRVIKCGMVEEMRLHDTAITPSGMLYQRFVVRQINPSRYRQPYIGQGAMAEQIRQKTDEAANLKMKLSFLQIRCDLYGRLREIQGLSDNDVNNLLEWAASLSDLQELQQQLKESIDRYGSLDLSYLQRLENEIDDIALQVKDKNKFRDSLIRERGRAENRLESINGDLVPHLEEQHRQKKVEIEKAFPLDWRENNGEQSFSEALQDIKIPGEIIGHYAGKLEETSGAAGLHRDELLRLRSNYNSEYKASLDISRENNNDWENEAVRLKETRLTEYEEKIKKAREKAQLQFQEDFISKLRENIETVERQLFELNMAMKDIPFGRDRYRFSVVPNRQYQRYYDMVMSDLLIQGHNVFSEEFQSKYRDVVDELFRQIVGLEGGEPSPDKRMQMERNLEHFTDFRTYLDFDLIVSDGDGNESRLSRIISKKSGGETQTPFYISVLASFLQIYRVKQQGFNNTLRLIVFDEAYSKMDHQRISESVRLIKDLELQVIISAPTEKIADIAPLVDRNLCITRVDRETFVRAFDPRKLNEEGA